ncbi:MAG: transposase [Halorubrum sp.]|uniref:RNA-guided endonuclease InsQ/TnpB family protein n=1 Tax=Halorubrum sp. TaxID=1879286 RepID=UPI003970643D
MTAVRNIQLKLAVDEEDHDLLDETFEQFRFAAQYVADVGWDDDPIGIVTNQGDLNAATYHEVRDQTDLTANHVQSARSLASDALSNCKERIFDGRRASKPEFRGTAVVYGARTVTYNDDYCTLSTVDGRVKTEYVLPADPAGTVFEDYWFDDDWEPREATLHKRDGDYFLHVAVQKDIDVDASTIKNGAVLGVDCNVDGSLAVTSTGMFLGNADYLNHRRDEFERRRGKLQQTGTRSAHLTIQSIGNRFSRWSEDYLHRVSKEVVREAREHDCSAIAFEKLEGIRERISNGSKFQQWAFRELRRHVEYKAEAYGITVTAVNPAYTSQRCSHGECGFTHRTNRNGDEFVCQKCGRELHADYNAARNVAWRLVQNWLKSGSGRANCQVALKSGTVNASGDFTPASDGQSGSSPTSPRL